MAQSIIEIKQLVKRYPKSDQLALQGIDLVINQGVFFGLLGPNGSGKTTLISILCGLLLATRGDLRIADYTIPKQMGVIKPLIGLVPQNIALYPTLSLRENLRYFGHLYGLKGKQLRHRMDQCIVQASLQDYADRAINTYSGGMQRRANLIVSLIHQPQILFLDEPTVNVDPQSREAIYKILRDMHQQGKTIIYTSHYLEEIEQLCDEVAIIDLGQVICHASPKDLIAGVAGASDLGQVFMHYTGHALRD